MERQDDRPRAHPEQEAGLREEAMPEEGPAEADAAREYSDAGSDRGEAEGEHVDTSRRNGGAESSAVTSTPGTREGPAEAPAGVPTEGPAYLGSASQPGSPGTREGEAAYEAAAERKAVVPPESEGRQSGTGTQATPGGVTLVEQAAVLSHEDTRTFRVRWETIQGSFIDDPHMATEQADALVGEVMKRITELREDYLRQLRAALGDGSDTEAMRVALQRYRAFFQMLLG